MFERLTPPVSWLDEQIDTPDGLRSAAQGVEWRWQLDAISALRDYVE